MGHAKWHDDHGRHAHAQRHRLTGVQVRQPLAEDDVQRPAQAGEGRQRHADGIQRAGAGLDRQQQAQAHDGQTDAGEMDGLSGMDQGQGQGPNELDGDGQTQRNGAQGHVEAEVHRPQHDAVKRDGAQVRAVQAEPPGPEDGDQKNGRNPDAIGRGPLRPDDRKQGLGEGGAARQRHHARKQRQIGDQARRQRRVQMGFQGQRRHGVKLA